MSPLPGLGVPANQVPGNVQTLRAADLDASHALDLSSFMGRRLGSVHLNEVQNNPFQPDVNYRGYTASPLLGTQQGLSVYLDGVRMNQPFGDVVSWDLIPKAAIASVSLMPGSNPLFGLNTLGGALAVQTKDGRSHPGSSVQVLAGENGRVAAEFESGGSQAGGLHWFVTGQKFKEDGWRVDSPSDVAQLFAKLGMKQRRHGVVAHRRCRRHRPERQRPSGATLPGARPGQRLHQARQHEEPRRPGEPGADPGAG